ncbi:MAG: hypothetical protein WD894_20085 [Pirellulales bacterium]
MDEKPTDEPEVTGWRILFTFLRGLNQVLWHAFGPLYLLLPIVIVLILAKMIGC